jgi:hypothetical protein
MSQLDRMMAESDARTHRARPNDLEGVEKRVDLVERWRGLEARCQDLEVRGGGEGGWCVRVWTAREDGTGRVVSALKGVDRGIW